MKRSRAGVQLDWSAQRARQNFCCCWRYDFARAGHFSIRHAVTHRRRFNRHQFSGQCKIRRRFERRAANQCKRTEATVVHLSENDKAWSLFRFLFFPNIIFSLFVTIRSPLFLNLNRLSSMYRPLSIIWIEMLWARWFYLNFIFCVFILRICIYFGLLDDLSIARRSHQTNQLFRKYRWRFYPEHNNTVRTKPHSNAYRLDIASNSSDTPTFN